MVNTRSLTTCFSQASIDHHSTTSAAFVGSNDDLLTEILLRLPAKSILRFKSVSKHWRLLLTHRHFTHRYDNNNLSKIPSLFVTFDRNTIHVPFNIENQNTPPFDSLDFCNDLYGIVAVQSCNGLLLCCSNTPLPMRDRRKYYVFNPTTKQFQVIRSIIGGPTARKAICFMGLAFHQIDRVHFKLVCARCLKRNEGLFQIQVYSSETRKWKIVIESLSEDELVFKKGVYWNGAVYWAPFRGRYFCFKIDDEQLQTLPLPEGPSKVNTWYFGESRGHLHLILHVDCEKNCYIVYEMLRDHSGWFAKYQVQLDELLASFLEIGDPYGLFYDLTLVDVVRGETEEDTFMVLHSKAKIITYNVHEKNCKLIFTLPKNFSEHYGHKILTYEDFYENFSCFHRHIETLTSL